MIEFGANMTRQMEVVEDENKMGLNILSGNRGLFDIMVAERIIQKKLKIFVVLGVLINIIGCEKTRTLHQEVLLNTGEGVIATWVVDYNFQGDAGNPMNIKMRPKRLMTLTFDYRGKEYRYRGDASLFLLAISPKGVPNLVLYPDGFAWDSKNNYRCTVPYYAQLIPDETGKTWTFPSNIEPWLYGLKGNLSLRIFDEENPPKIKSASQTIREEYSSKRGDEARFQFVDSSYTTNNCIKGN